MEQTVKCPICGIPHTFYPFFAGDQSACPNCISKAHSLEKNKWNTVDIVSGCGSKTTTPDI